MAPYLPLWAPSHIVGRWSSPAVLSTGLSTVALLLSPSPLCPRANHHNNHQLQALRKKSWLKWIFTQNFITSYAVSLQPNINLLIYLTHIMCRHTYSVDMSCLSVCVSVCLLVMTVNSGKIAEQTEMPFGVVGQVGLRNHVTNGAQIPQSKWQISAGKLHGKM